MLFTKFISLLTLAYATLSYCLTTNAPLFSIDWDILPNIPNPQTPAEYANAVALIHDAINGTALEAFLFGNFSPFDHEPEVRAMSVLHCETSSGSPSLLDVIMAVKNLRGMDQCNHPAPRLNECTELIRWSSAAIGRCDEFRQRNNPFSCTSAAGYIQELIDSGCSKAFGGKKLIGGYVGFKFHVGSPYSHINCYRV